MSAAPCTGKTHAPGASREDATSHNLRPTSWRRMPGASREGAKSQPLDAKERPLAQRPLAADRLAAPGLAPRMLGVRGAMPEDAVDSL